MTSLGAVSGTLHQVTAYADITYPASGHCAENQISVPLESSTFPAGITYTYFCVGGGFWVEGMINGVPQGVPLPVQVGMNAANSLISSVNPSGVPAWNVYVTLYADDVFEQLGATSYDNYRLHASAYFIVSDITETGDYASQ